MATPPFLPDETKPADTDIISQYPAVERTFRDVMESWVGVDHDTAGEHSQITLPVRGSDPSSAADTGFLYTKDDGTDTELFYEDDGGNVAQLTKDGGIASWTLLDTQTAAGSSSLDFTAGIDGTHDIYMFVLAGVVPATDSTSLRLRIDTDGGVSFDDATVYKYSALVLQDDVDGDTYSVIRATAANRIQLSDAIGNGADEGIQGVVHMFDPARSGVRTRFTYHTVSLDGAGELNVVQGGGQHPTTTNVDAVQFFMSSGNIASGTIKLYGLTK